MLQRTALAFGLVTVACNGASDAPSSTIAVAAQPASNLQPPTATARVTSLAPGQNRPNFLRVNASLSAKTLARSGVRVTAEGAAREHLSAFARYYGLDPAQASKLELRDVHDVGRGAVIARFGRRVNGSDVFGEQIAVAMDRNLEPVAFTGYVSDSTAKRSLKRRSGDPRPDPANAVVAAVAELTHVQVDPRELDVAAMGAGPFRPVALSALALREAGVTSSTPARIKPVLFPSADGQLLEAHYVETDLGPGRDGKPRAFSFVVGAGGKILWKKNLTAFDNPYSYRVFADDKGLYTPWDGPQGTAPTPHPTGELDHYQAPFVSPNLVTLSSLHAVGVDDPWLPPGATTTLGNNVDAYLDITDPDGFTPGLDFRGTVSSPGAFDYVYQPLLDSTSRSQRLAGITQLFYTVNWLHDWFYAAGFNEASGNAQFSNYGRGGLEGDALRAEAQDASGWNNANMTTPADGSRPTMQIYIQNSGAAHVIVTNPPELCGEFAAGAASFTPLHFDVHGAIRRAEPAEACEPLIGDYTQALVLVDDGGDCDALTKAQNAQAAGASGVIIANVPGPGSDSLQEPFAPGAPLEIAVLTVDSVTGERLRGALSAGQSIGASMRRDSVLRDNDVDNQTISHEWGHYISNRLVADATGLDTNMSTGLGEGWGDFHALLLTVREEDARSPANLDWSGVYALFGFTSFSYFTDPYYYGIRRYPYSTDMTKDPLTFGHISDDKPLPEGVPNSGDGTHSEVHRIGEVWATMLWECYAALLRDTEGIAPRLTFAEARDRMRDYLVAAYKLTPHSPTLLEARDALLTAALLNDPVDHARFAQAFAKRGAGVFAEAPDRFDDDNHGVVESFGYGAAVVVTNAVLADDVAAACVADGYLDDGETGRLHLTLENIGNAPTQSLSARVSTPTPGLTLQNGGVVTVPALPIQGTTEVSLPVTAHGLSGITLLGFSVQLDDAGAGAPAPRGFEFAGNIEQLPHQSFTDGAESSHSVWTSVPSVPSLQPSSGWHRNASSPLEHAYGCRSASLAATIDFVSPPLQVVSGRQLSLSFRQRFSFEHDDFANYDGGVIELSRDGGLSWQDIGAAAGYTGEIFADSGNPLGGRTAFVGQSADYPAFSAVTLPLDAGDASSVLVRFRVASDSGVGSPGWELDDLRFDGVSQPLFDAVVAQPAKCNNLPLAQVGPDQFIDDVDATSAPTQVILDGSGSFDADGDALTYRWEQLGGPAVELTGADSVQPSFAAPDVPSGAAPVTLTFQLIVSDAAALSTPALVQVIVSDAAVAPETDAGVASEAGTVSNPEGSDPEASDAGG